jgi:iron(III) transport system substrate-binding protein
MDSLNRNYSHLIRLIRIHLFNMKRLSVCRLGLVWLGVGALVSLIQGCQTVASTTSKGELNVYSARHYDSDDLIYKKFTDETGIKINVVAGKDDELIERIKSEGAQSPADVFITVDAARLWRAQQKSLFQPVKSQLLEQRIPASLRHPEGYWYGLTKRARVIVYNKAKVKPASLSTYEALAEPQWKGKVCIRSSGNVYNQSMLGSMLATRGEAATEKWSRGLVQNFARAPQGGDTDQLKAVAEGQCEVAVVNHYYLVRLQQSKNEKNREMAAKIGVFFPNQSDRGTHVNISGAGVVANAPHKESAVRFLEFLSSPAAQNVFAQENEEFPAVTDVPLSAALKPLGTFKADTVNVNTYGQNSDAAVKIADRAGWK